MGNKTPKLQDLLAKLEAAVRNAVRAGIDENQLVYEVRAIYSEIAVERAEAIDDGDEMESDYD